MKMIRFGEPDETWQQYGLIQAPIIYDGDNSGYKVIERNGKLVAILSKYYELLPNEEALKAADEAARLVGLNPFIQKGKKGLFFNRRKTFMHAWYSPEESYEIEKENVHVGVDVRNSIDGTASFGCGAFTFRSICSNGVVIGYKSIGGVTKIHTKGLKPMILNLKNEKFKIWFKRAAYAEKVARLLTGEDTKCPVEQTLTVATL